MYSFEKKCLLVYYAVIFTILQYYSITVFEKQKNMDL